MSSCNFQLKPAKSTDDSNICDLFPDSATCSGLGMSFAQATATAGAKAQATATAEAQATGTAEAQASATAEAVASATAEAGATATAEAQASATAEAQASATAEAIASATAEAQASATAEAQASATAEAQASATAQAQASATAQAQASATAQAMASATAQAQASATAHAQATSTAIAMTYVQSTTPIRNATDIDPNTEVTVVFETAMDETTINENTVYIAPKYSTRRIPAGYMYDAPTKTLTMYPMRNLNPKYDYEIVVTTAVENSLDVPQPVIYREGFKQMGGFINVHGLDTEGPSITMKTKCSTNATGLGYSIDNSGTLSWVDSDCLDGTASFTLTLPTSEVDYELTLTAGVGGGNTSSKTVTIKRCTFGTITEAGSFAGGTGTDIDPYLINTQAQLARMNSFKTSSFKLTSGIPLSCKEWTPIGTSGSKFQGSFDGNGYAIKRLNVTSTGSYKGLFGYVDDGSKGKFKNIKIYSANLEVDNNYVGLLAGYATDVVNLDNVHVSGRINASGSIYVGGIFGYINNSVINTLAYLDNSSMVDIYSSTTSTSSHMGGLHGYGLRTKYLSSSAHGNLANLGARLGGAFGFCDYCDLQKCHATGNLTGDQYVGGFGADIGESVINQCFATGKINIQGAEAGINSGGFGAYLCSSNAITDSYATGDMSGGSHNYRGSFGGAICMSTTVNRVYGQGERLANGTFQPFSNGISGGANNYYYTDEGCGASSPGCSGNGGTGYNTNMMQKSSSYNTWDFNNVWQIEEDASFPYLKWEKE